MKRKILYVDDEEVLVQLGKDLLSDFGYEVICAYSGEQALGLLELHQGSIELLITDESMPGISGIELAQKVYLLAPDLPVILCSGHMLTMREKGLEKTNVRNVLIKTEACMKLPEIIEKLLA